MEEVMQNQSHRGQSVGVNGEISTKRKDGYDIFATVKLPSARNEVFALSKECYRGSVIRTDWVENILTTTPFPEEHNLSEVDLVKISPKDLGICRYMTRGEIYDIAASLGLKSCPQETAIRFVDQVDRTFDGELVFASSPLYDSSGSGALLTIQRQKNRSIIAARFSGWHLFWKPDSQWLFATQSDKKPNE